MTARRESERLELERIKNFALGVRLGFADEKEWNRFLKETRTT